MRALVGRCGIFVAIWCFSLSLGTPSRGIAQELADTIERAEASVVRIEVTGRDGESLGSGFVVDTQGTFVTNCHVLAGAYNATAYFENGSRADVLGTLLIDESRDIVVGRLSDNNAPAISVSTSLPRKGESVTALGSPHGLSFTVTNGIISAIRPSQEMATDLGRPNIQGTWIQVDAPLSPGNSGGPLINSAGEVVAMSTLASRGSAQNLNFGISGEDIRKAIRYSANNGLKSLDSGVGKIRMEDSRGGEPGMGPNGEPQILAKKPVPQSAFNDYVERGKSDFDGLIRGLRSEVRRLSVELREMRRGESYLPPLYQYREDSSPSVRHQISNGRFKWFFKDSRVKNSAVMSQEKRIAKLREITDSVDGQDSADSMYKLLKTYGPEVSTRQPVSIGFASEIIVIRALNAHDAVVIYRDQPYLMWFNTTSGLNMGDFVSGPIFVAGTATLQSSQGASLALTMLQEIPHEELRVAVEKYYGSSIGGEAVGEDGYRTWRDRTGKFSVEAKLLGSDGTKAVLQKRDGSIINVPISKLSDDDLLELDH